MAGKKTILVLDHRQDRIDLERKLSGKYCIFKIKGISLVGRYKDDADLLIVNPHCLEGGMHLEIAPEMIELINEMLQRIPVIICNEIAAEKEIREFMEKLTSSAHDAVLMEKPIIYSDLMDVIRRLLKEGIHA